MTTIDEDAFEAAKQELGDYPYFGISDVRHFLLVYLSRVARGDQPQRDQGGSPA